MDIFQSFPGPVPHAFHRKEGTVPLLTAHLFQPLETNAALLQVGAKARSKAHGAVIMAQEVQLGGVVPQEEVVHERRAREKEQEEEESAARAAAEAEESPSGKSPSKMAECGVRR